MNGFIHLILRRSCVVAGCPHLMQYAGSTGFTLGTIRRSPSRCAFGSAPGAGAAAALKPPAGAVATAAAAAVELPQLVQNFVPSVSVAPQRGQNMVTPPSRKVCGGLCPPPLLF